MVEKDSKIAQCPQNFLPLYYLRHFQEHRENTLQTLFNFSETFWVKLLRALSFFLLFLSFIEALLTVDSKIVK